MKVAGFSTNIVSIVQDKEVLVLAMENNTLIVYDWKEGEAIDEYSERQENDTMVSHMRIEERNASIFIATEKSGDIQIFRMKP